MEHDYRDAIYIQGGELVSFVETSGQGSSVIIMHPDGSGLQKIAYSSDRIFSLTWVERANKLYYTNKDGVYSIELSP